MEPEPTLLAIAEVIGTAMIDHGSTVVVRLEHRKATRSPCSYRKPSRRP